MRTTATRHAHDTTPAAVLLMACELRDNTWQLGFTTGPGHKPRERTVAARELARVLPAIAQAKRHFDLPDTAPVVRCSAAGREGSWLHRFWQTHGSTNSVVDSSAIAVKRRQRRATSGGLDVRKLLRMLMRYESGERQGWRVVPVPSVAAADQRHLHRDLESLKQERASPTTRITGLLRSQGIRLTSLTTCPAQRDALRRWEGSARARDDPGVGLEWAAVSAGEGREWLVSRALWRRRQAVKAYGHGGGGAEVAHGPVVLPGDRRNP